MKLSERIRKTGKTTDLDAVTYSGKEYKEMYQQAKQLEAELEDEKLRSDVYDKSFRKAHNKNKQLEAALLAHKDNEGDECPLCQCEAELEKYRTKFADNTCAECLLCGIECDCDALKEGG